MHSEQERQLPQVYSWNKNQTKKKIQIICHFKHGARQPECNNSRFNQKQKKDRTSQTKKMNPPLPAEND